MKSWFVALDRILRGEATRLSQLKEGKIDIPGGGLTVVIILLGAFHGTCMGWFALFNRDEPVYIQLLASAIKVPLLFLLTLVVTFPSLYVFNALVGSRLRIDSLFRLLIAALSVALAVLASFGPIIAFFSLTTSNYPFMVLLNVVTFAITGLLGLAFLLKTLHRLTLTGTSPPPVPPAPLEPILVEVQPASAECEQTPPAPTKTATSEPEGALDPVEGSILGDNVKVVFFCWLVLFALVGAQMSWVLRPFIGDPELPFAWFRPRESHFFEAVMRTLIRLFGQDVP